MHGVQHTYIASVVVTIVLCANLFTDRVSRERKTIGSVRPSVRHFVFALSLEPTDL